MKIRDISRGALLLAVACSAAVIDTPAQKKVELTAGQEKISKDEILAMNAEIDAGLIAKGIQTVAPAHPTQTSKAYSGTEGAPIDGLDGKPRIGPFVDKGADDIKKAAVGKPSAAALKEEPTMLARLKQEIPNIPDKNNGVMDDVSRQGPAPGTTGTEGGVSEKAKEKARQGPLAENTPPEPKALPPLPHSEKERIREEQEKAGVKTAKDIDVDDKGEIPGAMGIEKPDNLPDKPHNIPHPDGKIGGNSRLVDTLPYTEGEKPKPSKFVPPAKSAAADNVSHDHSFEEWFHSFVVSLTMIIFTEIGDKTFLVAALMAMRHDRLVVFSAALSALIAMTILSAVLGHLAPTLLPKRLTTLAAAILFVVFGARMLREGLSMSKHAGVGEEMEEVEAELEEKEHDMARRKDGLLEAGRADIESAKPKTGALSGLTNLLGLVLSPAWVQTFIMTFLGEWGDRSQIATIAMAAGQDYWWVTLGAILGHALCTGLAVVGGRALAGKVSMRVVTIGGATAFLFFGVLYLVECYFEA